MTLPSSVQRMCAAFIRRAIPSASIFCSRLSTATSEAEYLDAIGECYSVREVGGSVPLAGEWLLCRDFAVRSAGFPVSGLEVFGPGDESARLRLVARDPAFREAVT